MPGRTPHPRSDLPTRKHGASSRKSPVFHLAHDDDDDDDDASSPNEYLAQPPPTFSAPRATSPSPSFSPSQSPRVTPTSPRLPLSSGKPLKSSLRPPSLSHPTPTCPQSRRHHSRARSEPPHKYVHFPENDSALASVRVFNCSARPAAISSPINGNGDETETDEETRSACFPFLPPPPVSTYEIDPTKSSPVPSEFSPAANLLLESLILPSPSSSSSSPAADPLLTGFILVRNLAFEKDVAIRFTLDDWKTVSETGARYVESLPLLPCQIHSSPSAFASEEPTRRGRGWDRFAFTIRLHDYVHSLSSRTIWLAARYGVNSTFPEPGSTQYGPGGEWWDNNGGTNYRVRFRPAVSTLTIPRSRPRRETLSTPISSSRSEPQSAVTCKEHAFGHMALSVPNSKPVNETNTCSSPPRAGKLILCNYVSPENGIASSIASLSIGSPGRSSPSSPMNPELPSSTVVQSSCDEDTVSPASSTLSTPCASPTMTPRVIIGGLLATSVDPRSLGNMDEDALMPSRHGHIPDFDWSAPDKPQVDERFRSRAEHITVSGLLERLYDLPSSPGRRALVDSSSSLYNALVAQWCFAQGPSPAHIGHGDGGILA